MNSSKQSEQSDDFIRDLLTRIVDQLSEHVESVQLFVSLHDVATDKTHTWEHGAGNRLARTFQGQRGLDRETIEDEYEAECPLDEDDEDDE